MPKSSIIVPSDVVLISVYTKIERRKSETPTKMKIVSQRSCTSIFKKIIECDLVSQSLAFLSATNKKFQFLEGYICKIKLLIVLLTKKSTNLTREFPYILLARENSFPKKQTTLREYDFFVVFCCRALKSSIQKLKKMH